MNSALSRPNYGQKVKKLRRKSALLQIKLHTKNVSYRSLIESTLGDSDRNIRRIVPMPRNGDVRPRNAG